MSLEQLEAFAAVDGIGRAFTALVINGKVHRPFVHFERGDTFSYWDPTTKAWVQGAQTVPLHARESLTVGERQRVEDRLALLGRLWQ
jgi:hypothetical protein